MSTSNQTADLSTANFTAIFDAASNEYKTLTKQDLETHPFAAAFENSNSPDSVINVFRKQAQAFDKFRKGDDKLMAWLTPIVNILLTFSGTLGEGIGLVSIQSFVIYQSCDVYFISLSRPQRRFSLVLGSFSGSVYHFQTPQMSIRITFDPGGEGRYRKLRSARETFRAHAILPSTSSSLHISFTHPGDDGTARENHGSDALSSCTFDQDNEREAN
jgi:hypothetical protein